jgi:outer membrane beta-barrel protein
MSTRYTTVRSAIISAALMVAFSQSAVAQQKGKKAQSAPAPAPAVAPAASSPAPAAKAKDDKVDISDLENKYWAPKDTDFSVVQNRTYTKDGRIFLTGHYGQVVNDQYSEGNVAGASLNYFFSERYGIQATYLAADLKNSQGTNDLINGFGSGVTPNHGKLSSYYGVGFNWVPFYAKMSFLGKKIIYFDMAVTPTLGFTQYDQQIEGGNKTKSSLTYGLDLTQYFFFTNYFAIRADVRNQWRKEEIVNYRGTLMGQKVNDKNIHDTMFLLGVTFFY